MKTYSATYAGQTFTKRSATQVFTHVTIIRHNRTDELIDARWSKSEAAALKPLPNGWEPYRVATVTATAV